MIEPVEAVRESTEKLNRSLDATGVGVVIPTWIILGVLVLHVWHHW